MLILSAKRPGRLYFVDRVLVTKYIPLSDAEAQAILYHDGQYVEENRSIRHKEEPLTLLAHWADYWTAHIYEEGRELKPSNDHFKRAK